MARSALLARAPSAGRRLDRLHSEVERSGVRFDGRLRVAAVDRRTGRRVVFGAPGAPSASVADAVARLVRDPVGLRPGAIGGREYVDGGVWSVTNLDAAPAGRGSTCCAWIPSAGLARADGLGHGALRQAFRAAAAVEIQVLRGRGAHVHHVGPDPAAAEAMGHNLMDPAGRIACSRPATGRARPALAGGSRVAVVAAAAAATAPAAAAVAHRRA